jgi:Trk-type K+ transport system membrane component
VIKQRLQSLSAVQFIFIAYLVAIVLCAALLMLPASRNPGVQITPLDAVFTATSAVSVTGLATVSTADTFSLFGQVVLLFAFEFGGIGIMTLGTLLWVLFGQNVTLTQRKLLMADQNQNQLSGLVRLLRVIITMVLLVEAAGTLFFALYFRFTGFADGWMQSFYYALFHAISSFTNAGFDVFGDSMAAFRTDYAVQTVTMLLIVLGSVGYPVLAELWRYVRAGNERRSFRFSLFTKLTLTTYLALLAAGAFALWLLDRQTMLAGLPWHEQLFHALFHSVTARSGGLTTTDLSLYGTDSQLVMAILMFIGGSPSSAGGGIRTTTFAVLVLTLIAVARMRKDVTVYRRTVKQEDVMKSFFVFVLGILLCASSVLFISAAEGNRFPLEALVFEVASAFGTCGASLGITADLSGAAQGCLLLLMFVGRIGLVTLLGLFHKDRQRPVAYRYPEEKIIIG